MQRQTAVVLGATGLIGSHLVNALLKDDAFATVRVLVRRPYGLQHSKLQTEIVDFENLEDLEKAIGSGNSIFCCVGTTQKKVRGDRAAYKKVDFDIPANSATIAVEKGFSNYLLVSSVGADASSKNFYLKLKGEAEAATSSQPFKAALLFRPGFLLGDRKEFRPGEWIGKYLMKVFGFLLRGKYEKYKAIEAADVAKGMVAASKKNLTGIHTFQNSEIEALASDYKPESNW